MTINLWVFGVIYGVIALYTVMVIDVLDAYIHPVVKLVSGLMWPIFVVTALPIWLYGKLER